MNAYDVGLLTGSMIPLAAIGYFLGRKLAGPSGSTEVARLTHAAGLAAPGSTSPSALRGLVPYLLAVGGAMVGLGLGVLSLRKEHAREVDPVALHKSYLSGCQQSCVRDNANAPLCEAFCACALRELQRSHPTASALSDFFQAAQDKKPAAQQEYQRAQATCVHAVRAAR